jgi:ABC-2 type transport system ATP-binding protein
MKAILIEGLTKAVSSGWPGRPPISILSGLSLSVERGEIYGFLGPNGAGKTTTLKILMGLMRPTAGQVELLGRRAGDVEVRRQIGFLPESPYFYDYLTAEEFLYFYGRLAGVGSRRLEREVSRLLELTGLTEARARQLRKFSKGMLQRVGLAQALIHDPELIILDEPMSGLDPLGRKHVRDLMLSLREQGKTVFFSTHIIPDVEMICDRVGIIVKGQMVAAGRVDDLVSRGDTESVEVVCEGLNGGAVTEASKLAVRVMSRGRQSLLVLPGADVLDETLALIRRHEGRLVSVTPQKRSLEDLFLKEDGGHSQMKAASCGKSV